MRFLRTCGLAISSLVIMGVPAWAAPEEEAVRQVVLGTVKAIADFPSTRDDQSVLGHYSKDYVGVQDGESETLEAVRNWLKEYGSLLDQGSSIRYAGEISDLSIRVAGGTAWATYRYVFQMLSAGQVQGEDRGLCTNILRKEATGWVIQHEHCSQKRKAQPGS